MTEGFVGQPWFLWAVGIAVGLPLAMIFLGELSVRLQNRGNALYKPINTLRYFVVPAAAFILLLTYVVGWPSGDTRVRILNTVFWFFGLLTVLSFFNSALFINADVRSWRAKLPRIFIDLARVFLIAGGIAVLSSAVWGANPTGFFTALGVTSIVIGFTLQNSIGGIISGLLVLFEQPFQIGDHLSIGGTVGKVVEVNWRATHLDTGNSLQIVPNSGLAGAQFANFSRPKLSHDDSVSLKFAASDPPNAVKRMLCDLARSLPQVDPESEPCASVTALDGSVLVYQITFTVQYFDQAAAARDEFLTRIWYAASRSKLTVVGLTPDGQAKTAAVSDGLRRVADQLYIDDDQVLELVPYAHVERYAAGEVVQRPGAVVPDTRFILAGRVRSDLPDPVLGLIPVMEMETGDVFGGLTVLADRTSLRIVATEDLHLISITRDALERLIDRKPRLAQWFGEIAERRATQLRALRAANQKRSVRSDGHAVGSYN